MNYAFYYTPHPAAHEFAPPSFYPNAIRLLKQSVNSLGKSLIHIGDVDQPCLGDDFFIVDESDTPGEVVANRDRAWLEATRHLKADQQLVMLEPDMLLLAHIPPTDKDIALLHRHGDCFCGWFRLTTSRSVPLLEQVVRNYDDTTVAQRTSWLNHPHGDIQCWSRALGITDRMDKRNLPLSAHGVSIAWRSHLQYSGKRRNGITHLLHFKGRSKKFMR